MSSLLRDEISENRSLSFTSINSEGTELSVDDLSINGDEKRSMRSIYSSMNSYSTPSVHSEGKLTPLKSNRSGDGEHLNLSDAKYLPLHSYSEWFLDYHRKRSPYSKIYLQDIKEILLQEVKTIDNELCTIDTEKRTLLDIHSLLENLRNALWESERNSQGLLVPDKLKGIVEKAVVGLNNQEHAVAKESNVPFFNELRKNLKRISSTSYALQQTLCARIKIEDVEELFSQSGLLYGIVHTILMIFYEKTSITDDCRSRTQSKGGRHANGKKDPITPDDANTSMCLNCLENIKSKESSPTTCGQSKRLSKDGDLSRSQLFGDSGPSSSLTDSGIEFDVFGPYDDRETNSKDNVVELTKDITKVKKQLKTIERMTSGRPKMKFLLKKFEEVRTILRLDEPKDIKRYAYVFEENLNQLRNVLKTEKPNQCDLDNTRFLLSQLSGRATIVLKLESDGLY